MNSWRSNAPRFFEVQNDKNDRFTKKVSRIVKIVHSGATNGIAHMGHHYAMAHAAAKLNLPALQKQEGLSGM